MWLVTDGVSGRWEPGIGDPTFLGWFTVLAYGFTAYLCASAYRVVLGNHDNPRRAEDRATLRKFWVGLGWLMAFLAVNKQLDLQTLLTEIARDAAREQGWYDTRRSVQVGFVKLVGLLALVTGSVITWRMRRLLGFVLRPLLGIVCLLTFVTARAASFHHLDLMLRTEVLGLRTNGIFELSGIALVAWGARRIGAGKAFFSYVRQRLDRSALMRWLPQAWYQPVRHAIRWVTGELAAERAEAVERRYTVPRSGSVPFPPRPGTDPHPGGRAPQAPPSGRPSDPVQPLRRPGQPQDKQARVKPRREETHIQVTVRDVRTPPNSNES